MKRIFTLAAIVIASVSTVFAQNQPKDEGWKDRIKAEKIAFITTDLNLTPEEAQVFWPVYNKYNTQKAELNKAVRDAYMALDEALKTGADIAAKLDAYAKAMDAQKAGMAAEVKDYKKVIPVEKIAKLYVSEEKFRFNQIEKLHKGGEHGGNPADGPKEPKGGKMQEKGGRPQPIEGQGPQAPAAPIAK